MQKSQINPEIVQALLESASNAAAKGQSQFFTPVPFGQLLATALPPCRPTLVDLTCGAGHLLQASAGKDTSTLLGADVDPCRNAKVEGLTATLGLNRLTCELTRLYPLLHEVEWRADCFVLNPPWGLHLYRERLAPLAASTLTAVRDAFAATEDPFNGGCPKDGIDSSIAALAIALDRCTIYGEGLLISNDSTLQRLLFAPGAPYAALARHVWAHVRIPGNPMTGLDHCSFQEGQQFYTSVLYFAREHTRGPQHFDAGLGVELAAWLKTARQYRQGAELRSAYLAADSVEAWLAVKERAAELAGHERKTPWNLWLTAGGRIRTALSRFETKSTRVNKQEAQRLFALNGKAPMELVLQRAQRDELLHVAQQAGWLVQPELLAAVTAAIQEYHAARAPLYPLPEIQRLGYLDEQDSIACKRELGGFKAGQSYPIRTQTVSVTRTTKKPNAFTGLEEELEFSGQELAIYLKVGDREYCFMDAKLKEDEHTQVANGKQHKQTHCSDPDELAARAHAKAAEPAIDYTLQDLCAHFTIPDVPDVATVNPKGYEQFLTQLAELEALTAA